MVIIVKRLCFENYEEFVSLVDNVFTDIREKDSYNDISIIAKYEESREIMRELVAFGYTPCGIELHEPEWDGYDDEYILSLANLDGEDEFFCEPMCRDGHYIVDESTVIYVLDNCSSKVVSRCRGEEVFEVCVGCDFCEDDEYDDECCCASCAVHALDVDESVSTHISRDEDGIPVGFRKSWSTTEDGMSCYSSYSHYSNNLDMLKEIAADFGVRL